MTTLAELLNDYQLSFKPQDAQPGDCVLAWGLRPSALRAYRYAATRGLAPRYVEDGFLRSVNPGPNSPTFAVVIDDIGLYLDARKPSRLEQLIQEPLGVPERQRIRALIAAWKQGRVSKYNHARDDFATTGPDGVLVVDQTYGDASVTCGGAGIHSFQEMLSCALAENPDNTVFLKVHPDVIAGRKKGYFDLEQVRKNGRICLIDYDVHPAALFERVKKVYTVTSQIGFEALLWDIPVRVFGMPFYGGWGLTQDDMPPPSRRRPVQLEQLVHAALIRYSRYVHPETNQRCEVEDVLEWLALQRRMRNRFDQKIIALGFSSWKRPFVRSFLGGSQVRFARWPRRVPASATLAVWGHKSDKALARARSPRRIIRIEDGFLRSVGLGADLTQPLSWVQDDVGIYYDARSPSRLEELLAHADFSSELLNRAVALRRRILDGGITKYNLPGEKPWSRPACGKRIILVPGQVESDASISYGASTIRDNETLVRTAREMNPGAYIVYKPHPDVAAGLRSSGTREHAVSSWCDEIVVDASFDKLLQQVDEVHVITSLAGFEALLRSVPVTTYGQPFYAGWGVTRDMALTDAVKKRRQRTLTLDELTAATLILYPAYVSRATGQFTTPERTLDELEAWRRQPQSLAGQKWSRLVGRLFRKR